MRETEALVRVQEIDLALMRHQRTLADMPQTKKIQAVQAARKKLASQLSRIVGERKDAQMEFDENEAKLARLNEIVGEVRSKYEGGNAGYRELADLEAQLTSLAKRVEKREFNRPGLAERLEKTQTAEANARALDRKLVAEGQALVASYKDLTADIQRDIEMLKRERAEVAQSITPEVMERYDTAARRFGGLAVETLTGTTPSVCRVAVPPSSYNDIHRGSAIAECPYCHRILVVE